MKTTLTDKNAQEPNEGNRSKDTKRVPDMPHGTGKYLSIIKQGDSIRIPDIKLRLWRTATLKDHKAYNRAAQIYLQNQANDAPLPFMHKKPFKTTQP